MKKILDFLKRNTVLKVFSLILAILLWAYVQLTQNPEIVYEVIEVPITITGEADMESRGFVMGTLPKNMVTNVTITASRSKIQSIDTSDLFAYVDVSQCNSIGDSTFPVKVRSNDSEITVMNKSPSSYSLYIDKIITTEKPVRVSLKGTLDENYFVDRKNIKVSPENATLKIPELLSKDVEEVVVNVDLTEIKASIKESFPGIAMTEEAQSVSSDKLSFATEKFDVEIPVLKKKKVPVRIGNQREDVAFDLNVESIEIAGPEKNLNFVNAIIGYVNDYSPSKDLSSYKVTLKIPEGFVLVDESEVMAYPRKISVFPSEKEKN